MEDGSLLDVEGLPELGLLLGLAELADSSDDQVEGVHLDLISHIKVGWLRAPGFQLLHMARRSLSSSLFLKELCKDFLLLNTVFLRLLVVFLALFGVFLRRLIS